MLIATEEEIAAKVSKKRPSVMPFELCDSADDTDNISMVQATEDKI